MTIIETPAIILVGDDGHDGSVCLVEEHPAHENVCTVCETLHMPSMLRVEYCACVEPVLSLPNGIVTWRCQECGRPNHDAIRRPLV